MCAISVLPRPTLPRPTLPRPTFRQGIRFHALGNRHRALCLLLFALAMLAPCHAQASERIEITPIFGYRTNPVAYPAFVFCFLADESLIAEGCPERVEGEDDGVFGLVVDVPLAGNWMLELRLDHQQSSQRFTLATGLTVDPDFGDLDITTFTVGGLYGWPSRHVEPFIAFGAGLASIDIEPFAFPPTDLEGAHLLLSLGGGIKLRPEKRLGVRLEVRGVYFDLSDTLADRLTVEASSGVTIRF